MVSVEPIALGELAARVGGEVRGDPARIVGRVAPLAEATAGELAPFFHLRYAALAATQSAQGVILLAERRVSARLPAPACAVVVADGADALASLLDTARIDDAPARVGPGCEIHATAVIGPRVVLGARVVVGPYAVVGGPGFGWVVGATGARRAVPQLGGVLLDDDVYVGAHCTIDSGTLGPTRIGKRTKLDAHVHVGHNVTIGEGCIVAAQAGFAGSVTLGQGVLVGGQAGFADHVVVGDGARVAAKAGVIGDVPAGAIVAGYPAIARTRWLRGMAELLRRRDRRKLP